MAAMCIISHGTGHDHMKILGFTTARSDYDLMSGLYRLIHLDDDMDLKLIVSGCHLSPNHGNTIKHIQRDGFNIVAALDTLVTTDDSRASQLKTASNLLQAAIDVVQQEKPDLIIYAGDREDVIIYSMIAAFLKIPSIHFWAGDHTTDGCIDNVVRHAASKFSNFHFVALEQHRERLIKIGENPKRIYNIGSMALDRFVQCPAINKQQLLQTLQLSELFDHYALLIFHPLHSEIAHYGEYLETIIQCVIAAGLSVCIGAPNTDPGYLAGFEVINRYREHPCCFYYENLERSQFISLYKHAQFIIGNSSSGILEAASVPIPAINVGKRERNRYCESNVVFCSPDAEDITRTIKKVTSSCFQQQLRHVKNPYGEGHSAEKALQLIKQLPLSEFLLKDEDPLMLDAPSVPPILAPST
jgi:UDP-N-acetylglucosamine 2-epimerase (non-hydrolysing)/GDP/UDP-N,N'-diacetylbacillosamine 2-epimerase (hydrolysing)